MGYVSDNLRHFMGEMSPAELSRITNVPAMTIGRILKDETSPQIETLERLAKGLKVSVCALACDDAELRNVIVQLSETTEDKFHAVRTLLGK